MDGADARSAAPNRVAVQVAGLIAFTVGVFVVVFRERLIPLKFYIDGNQIRGVANGSLSSSDDRSFQSIADVYRLLGLADRPLAAGLLSFAVAVGAIAVVAARGRAQPPPLVAAFVVAGLIILSAIYLGYYSKELAVVIVALVVAIAPRGIRGEFLILLVVLSYAAIFRSYWALTAIAYTGVRLCFRTRWPVRSVIVFGPLFLGAAVVFFNLFLGLDADHFRESVNSARSGGVDTNTVISPILSGGPVVQNLDLVLILLTLLVPVPLLLLGGPYYLALATGMILGWSGIVVATVRGLRHVGVSPDRDPFLRSCSLITAVLLVQSIFEPDYGSALRHLVPLASCLLTVVLVGLAPTDRQRADRPAEPLSREVITAP